MTQYQEKNTFLLSSLYKIRDAFVSSGKDQYIEKMLRALREENQHLRKQVKVLEQRSAHLLKENASLSQEVESAFLYQQELHDEYQATFQEQSYMLERRQAYIGKLEVKIQDLVDELKQLFSLDYSQISKHPKPWGASSKNFALQLLNNLKQIAFKIENIRSSLSFTQDTGLPVHNYVLEHRQLLDFLRDEQLGMLFIYSSHKKRLLFSHQLFKDWTGYHGEDFFKFKDKIISNPSWLSNEQLTNYGCNCGQIVIQTKMSGNQPFHYAVVSLNKGLFNNHLLGVFYPMGEELSRG